MEESTKSDIPVLFCHVPLEGRPFCISEMTQVILRLVSIMVSMKHPVISDIPVPLERGQESSATVAN